MKEIYSTKKILAVSLVAVCLLLEKGTIAYGQKDFYPDKVDERIIDSGADDYDEVREADAQIRQAPAAGGEDKVSKDFYAEEIGGVADDVMIDVLELKDMDITDVLKLLSNKSNLNIIAGKNIQGKVSIFLRNVKLKDALTIILDSNDLAYKMDEGIIRVMSANEFEQRYGYKFGGRVETAMTQLAFADADYVLGLLNQIKSRDGKIIADIKSNTLVLMDSREPLDIMLNMIKKIDVPVQTEVFALSYAKVEDIEDKIRGVLTDNVGQLKADKRSNKIAVTDTRLKIQEIAKLVQAFDEKQQQVLIEAKIVQIILSDQYKFGVDWEGIAADYHNLNFKSNFDILSSSEKRGTMSIGTLDSDNYTVLIEALEAVGMTNILSSPSITAVNNEEAKILVGSTEPYVTTTTTTPSSGPTTTAESVNFIEVGVKLYVTPTIHKDDFITLKIKPEVSSVTRTLTTSNNNIIPVVETSEAETTVMVKDGVTIVIGGLIKEERIDSENKVPFLGDIPLLGNAFRNEDSFTRKTEIVIFLTPKIISGEEPTRRDVKDL